MSRARAALLGFFALAASVVSAPAEAQRGAVDSTGAPRVIVRDSADRAIPYANVQSRGSTLQVASDSGVAVLRVARADSLRLLVRRVGFKPFEAWVRPSPDGSYRVIMTPLPQNIDRVTIFEANTPLARTGFYDRADRIRRTATVGRLITPEEIELRNASRTSRILEGEPYVRVRPMGMSQKPVLMGRSGNCPAGVVVDGQRMLGMVEEIYSSDGRREIEKAVGGSPSGEVLARAESDFLAKRTSIDELVAAISVIAIEIYPSMAGVPPELARAAPNYACSLVVIWTGRR